MVEILNAEGINGQVKIFENRVEITRKGARAFFSHGFDGTKIIFLKSISGLQFKECGKMTNGYLQFIFSGSKESKEGLLDAAKDENTVMFSAEQQQNFEQIKNAICEKL